LISFGDFFKKGLKVIEQIMEKLGPILEDLIPAIGSWITEHAHEILDKFWDFFKKGSQNY
jgi:hypothetical protein